MTDKLPDLIAELQTEITGMEASIVLRHPCRYCMDRDCGPACICERCCTRQQEQRKHIDRLKEILLKYETGEVERTDSNG